MGFRVESNSLCIAHISYDDIGLGIQWDIKDI